MWLALGEGKVVIVVKMMVVTVGHECARDGSNLSNNTFFCRRAAILSLQRNNMGSKATCKNCSSAS